MALPGGTDPTTETDRSLLEAAATADLPIVNPRDKRAGSEHPAGRTEVPADAPGGEPGARRRRPHKEGRQ